MKEQTYLRQIQKLQDELKDVHKEYQDRHNSVTDNLRSKHSTLLQAKDDEITDLTHSLNDIKD